MRTPRFVLYPRSKQEAYIDIDQIEPGSDLAWAVIALERKNEASWDRLRSIATYLKVKLHPYH